MALTQSDLDRLDAAIATSELEVEIDGRRVRYRDTASLISARTHVANVLIGTAAGGNAPVRSTYYPAMTLRRE